MNKTSKVSPFQLYTALLLSDFSMVCLLSLQDTESDMTDWLLAFVLSFLLHLVLAIPVLHRYTDTAPALRLQRERGRSVFWGVYAVLLSGILVCQTAQVLAQLKWASETEFIAVSLFWLAAGVALYTVIRGIETITRGSICILCMLLLMLLLLCVSLFKTVHWEYGSQLSDIHGNRLLKNTVLLSANQMTLPLLPVLLRFSNRTASSHFVLQQLLLCALGILLLAGIFMCLGSYGHTMPFPAYVLASVAEISGLQRLDSLFLGVVLLLYLLRLALVLFAVTACFSDKLSNRKKAVCTTFVAIALVLVVMLFCDGLVSLQAYLYPYRFVVNILLGTGVPLCFLGTKNKKGGMLA